MAYGHTRSLSLVALLMMGPACAEDRVESASRRRSAEVEALFARAQVAYPPGEIYVRAFKEEGVLELWAGERGGPLKQVHLFPICSASGTLGPKRQRGDLQVPEGFYVVDRFNPRSSFHLSLGLNYPNASDRVRAGKRDPGGDIFIHGACSTVGCLPLEDGPIEVLYLIARAARANGQKQIPVHIFPRRMDARGMALLHASTTDDSLRAFWEELLPGYLAFEETRRVPRVFVHRDGRYEVKRPEVSGL